MTITRRSTLAGIAGASLLGLPLAARAEGTLEATKKRGTFRVGVTQAPPWFSKDPKSGQWSTGVGVFMGKAMADKLGAKVRILATQLRELDVKPQKEIARRMITRHGHFMPPSLLDSQFAALEEPDLLVEDIRAFFRPLRFGAAND